MTAAATVIVFPVVVVATHFVFLILIAVVAGKVSVADEAPAAAAVAEIAKKKMLSVEAFVLVMR